MLKYVLSVRVSFVGIIRVQSSRRGGVEEQMVLTRSMVRERIYDAEQMILLTSLQKEMVEMNRKNEEMQRKSEKEILALRKENEEMKKKWVEGESIHISLYTSDNVFLCRVFPTSLKGGALS